MIRNLPADIVGEQVAAYRARDKPRKKDAEALQKKIRLGTIRTHQQRMSVCLRFRRYCLSLGMQHDKRMPYGATKTFIQDNLTWMSTKPPTGKHIQKWHMTWRESPANLEASETAVAEISKEQTVCVKSLLKSRKHITDSLRKRRPGAGRQYANLFVRQELYHWWCSMRYAIDWRQLIAENRSCGGTRKKNLARFPRSVLLVKVWQLQTEYAHASLLSGVNVRCFQPSYWWLSRWEEEYGLSLRKTNRKYAVPRAVQKERMELFWVTLFRIRLFISLKFGYEPAIFNFDQSPYHHNETGSQNKATLGVRGSTVPVVEGNSDVKSR